MLVSLGTRRKRIRSVSKSQMLWHESMRSITALQSWHIPAPGSRDDPGGKASGPLGVAPPCPSRSDLKRGYPTLRDHLSGFHRDGHRPVVHEFDVHVGGEASGGHPGTEPFQRGGERRDERLRL